MKRGKYGGTCTHKYIAFEFASAISPTFKLYLIKEFKRLKEDESSKERIEWNAKRFCLKIIYLDDKQTMINKKFIISLFFRQNKIYMVSLMCCEFEFSDYDEPERKLIHDEILREEGINIGVEYVLGKITSNYDSRSNLSSINIMYI